MKRLIVLLLALAGLACGMAGCGSASTPATPVPLQVKGWDSITVRTVCLEVEQSYPEIEHKSAEPIAEAVERILTGVGLQVVDEGDPCEATLTFVLTGEALGAKYTGGIHCYSGAAFSGGASLTSPGRELVTLPISARHVPPVSISGCHGEPIDAPFERVWPEALLDGLGHLWGTPPLIQALEDEEEWVRFAAAGVLGKISPEAKEAVPALIKAVGDQDESVRFAAARTLGKITGQDFGEDAAAWQEWWEEQQ